jgi:two-component system response regulator MprA
VLVVEDDRGLRLALRRALEGEGYEVAAAGDAVTAAARFGGVRPHLVVLDLLLPRGDGLDLCRRIRRRPDGQGVAVLILTARDAVADRVAGLDAGADDYVVKPVALEELLARARAQLRRVWRPAPEVLAYGGVELDPAGQVARRAGRAVDLTTTERHLLELFLRHPGQVLSQQAIGRHLWGLDFEAKSNIIAFYVRRLRRKLEAGGEPPLLHTVRGAGYALRERPYDPSVPVPRDETGRCSAVTRERDERYDRDVLSDAEWARLAPVLPPSRPRSGRPVEDRRLVVEGILWALRTGARWRDLPERFGPWYTVSSRFYQWVAAGRWDRVLAALQPPGDAAGAPDWGTPSVDGTTARAHPPAAGAQRGSVRARFAAAAARPAREAAS